MERRHLAVLAACATLLAATAAYLNFYLPNSGLRVSRASLSSFPTDLPPWKGSDTSLGASVLRLLAVDDYLMRQYSDGKDTFDLYIGYYRNQTEGAVPHSPRHCYPGGGWYELKSDLASIPVRHRGKVLSIRPNRYVFANGTERQCVIYWYQSRGRVVASEYLDKAFLVFDAIVRRRSDGALVRFSARASAGEEDRAFRKLEDAVSRIFPILPTFIPD